MIYNKATVEKLVKRISEEIDFCIHPQIPTIDADKGERETCIEIKPDPDSIRKAINKVIEEME